MTFTRVVKIVERAPAWEVCLHCEGRGKIADHLIADCSLGGRDCKYCQGSGGKWHEAVYYNKISKDYFVDQGDEVSIMNGKYCRVTKSSFLVREWGVCYLCEGLGPIVNYHTDGRSGECTNCQGTGAEPGTASPWRVYDS